MLLIIFDKRRGKKGKSIEKRRFISVFLWYSRRKDHLKMRLKNNHQIFS
jgi:hypothetical protein